jgi:3-oxoacyl-[acyl-carrier protein] reductase
MSEPSHKTESPDFQDRVALVTGASSGIGAATAKLLAARGARVVVNYHRGTDRAEQVAQEIRERGGEAVALAGDITDPEAVAALVAETENHYGAVDVLVANAAGISGRDLRLAPAAELEFADVDRVVGGQLRAFFHPVKAVLGGMLARGEGSIVAVGAAASRRPSPGFLSLAMAKATVEVAVKALAREVGPKGVRVNGVGPGLILSGIAEHIPEAVRADNAQRAAIRRNGLPEDVAETIVFLASARASYLTGTYVLLDGGIAML